MHTDCTPYTDCAAALTEHGWAVIDGFLVADEVAALAAEARRLWQDDAFVQAGVGRGATRQLRPEIRTDHVSWLDPDAPTDLQRGYQERMAVLRQTVNRELYLGLRSLEAHLALYAAGAFYRRHLDAFTGAPGRVLSAVLYLNEDWGPDDAGSLRLYVAGPGEETVHDIAPIGGRLALFLSAQIEHEVLPSARQRLSLTGWFRRD